MGQFSQFFLLKDTHYFPDRTHQNFNSLNAQCHPLLYPPDQLNPSSLHQRNTRSRRTYGGIDMVAITFFLKIRHSCRWWGNEADFFISYTIWHISPWQGSCVSICKMLRSYMQQLFFSMWQKFRWDDPEETVSHQLYLACCIFSSLFN